MLRSISYVIDINLYQKIKRLLTWIGGIRDSESKCFKFKLKKKLEIVSILNVGDMVTEQEMMNSLHPCYNLYVFHVVTALSCLMIRNAYSSSTLDLIRTNISKRYMTCWDYMIISITTDDRKRKWCLRRFGNQAFALVLSIW